MRFAHPRRKKIIDNSASVNMQYFFVSVPNHIWCVAHFAKMMAKIHRNDIDIFLFHKIFIASFEIISKSYSQHKIWCLRYATSSVFIFSVTKNRNFWRRWRLRFTILAIFIHIFFVQLIDKRHVNLRWFPTICRKKRRLRSLQMCLH